jgi:hypothetical protein
LARTAGGNASELSIAILDAVPMSGKDNNLSACSSCFFKDIQESTHVCLRKAEEGPSL